MKGQARKSMDKKAILAYEIEALCLRISIPFSIALLTEVINIVEEKKAKKQKKQKKGK